MVKPIREGRFMARFTFPGQYAMRVIDKDQLLAFFTFVDTETGLEYRDWKLMTGSNGRYVGSPTGKPYKDKEGKDQYPKFVREAYDVESKKRVQAGVEWFAALLEAAEAEYEQRSAGGSGGSTGRSTNRSSGKGSYTRPAASKMKYEDMFATDGDGDDDLPF
jgi:hypothetical protein